MRTAALTMTMAGKTENVVIAVQRGVGEEHGPNAM